MAASDGDNDTITYSLSNGTDDHFSINARSGQVDLVKSLDRESVREVRLEVWATDNGMFHRMTFVTYLVTYFYFAYIILLVSLRFAYMCRRLLNNYRDITQLNK